MLSQIRKNLYSWATPDPTGNSLRWGLMVGHLLIRDSGCILIDPPFVPDLIEAAKRLAKPEAILLTTQNHTRGARYLKEMLDIPVYLPEQDQRAVEPQELASVKEIGNFETYTEGNVLGVEAFRFMSDYAILTEQKDLIIGDNATGDENGAVLVSPGFLPLDPPYPPEDAEYKEFRDRTREAFRDLVRKTGATSLLASHGFDIVGSLQDKVKTVDKQR